MMKWKFTLPFLILLALFAGLLLSMDFWLKKGFITAGERAFEAKFEVEKVHLSYFPLSLNIQNIQAANAKSPMKNLFEIERISFELNTLAALQKKWIIDTLEITGISLNTPRKTSGKLDHPIKKAPPSQLSLALKSGLSSEIAELKDLVPELKLPETEKLNTTKALSDAYNDLQITQTKWGKITSGETINKELNAATQALNQAGTIKINSPTDLVNIQKTIQTTTTALDTLSRLSQKIEAQKKDIDQDLSRLNTWPKTIEAASKKDYENALAPFSLDKLKKHRINSGIFIDPIRQKINPYLKKLQKMIDFKKRFAAPQAPKFFERDPGITILFDTPKHYPKFLIKKVLIGGKGQNGEEITGKVTNITTEQHLIGQPMVGTLEGKNLFKTNTSALLSFSQDTGYSITKFNLNNLKLSQLSTTFPEGLIHAQSTHIFTKGNLNSQTKIIGNQLKFTKKMSSEALLENLITTLLNKIQVLSADLTIKGPLNALNIALNTNIEDALTNALSQAIQAQLDIEKAKLQAQLNQIVTEETTKLQKQIDQEKAKIDKLIADQLQQIQLVEKQLNSEKEKIDQEINRAQKKAQNDLIKQLRLSF